MMVILQKKSHRLGISSICFYNAVSCLRKRACQIPESVGRAYALDLTSHKQDVVWIAIEPEDFPAERIHAQSGNSMYLDGRGCRSIIYC